MLILEKRHVKQLNIEGGREGAGEEKEEGRGGREGWRKTKKKDKEKGGRQGEEERATKRKQNGSRKEKEKKSHELSQKGKQLTGDKALEYSACWPGCSAV